MSDLVDRLARFEAQATPAPWWTDGPWIQTGWATERQALADAELSVAVRNALPVLLAEHRLLEAVADAARVLENAVALDDVNESIRARLWNALARLDEHREQQQEAPQSGAEKGQA